MTLLFMDAFPGFFKQPVLRRPDPHPRDLRSCRSIEVEPAKQPGDKPLNENVLSGGEQSGTSAATGLFRQLQQLEPQQRQLDHDSSVVVLVQSLVDALQRIPDQGDQRNVGRLESRIVLHATQCLRRM